MFVKDNNSQINSDGVTRYRVKQPLVVEEDKSRIQKNIWWLNKIKIEYKQPLVAIRDKIRIQTTSTEYNPNQQFIITVIISLRLNITIPLQTLSVYCNCQ